MTGPEIFREALPELVAAAKAGDPNLSVLVRQAMRSLAHWDLPIGVKVDDVWIGLLPKKLEGVNRWMADWRLRSALRKKWGSLLWDVIARAEKCSAPSIVRELGRAPKCQARMAVQVVRLVPAVNQFLRDDDSLAGSPKQLYDAMKDVKLIREDRREWLQMLPPCQDVSPIASHAVTVFFLWPAPPPAEPVRKSLKGVRDDVHRQIHAPACGKGHAQDRGTEEGRTVPGVRRRVGPRAVDV